MLCSSEKAEQEFSVSTELPKYLQSASAATTTMSLSSRSVNYKSDCRYLEYKGQNIVHKTEFHDSLIALARIVCERKAGPETKDYEWPNRSHKPAVSITILPVIMDVTTTR